MSKDTNMIKVYLEPNGICTPTKIRIVFYATSRTPVDLLIDIYFRGPTSTQTSVINC